MNCPKCYEPLRISERQGIEIDYCPDCRGVWLDKGELDKIVERSLQYKPRDEYRREESRDEYRGDESRGEYRREESRDNYKKITKIIRKITKKINTINPTKRKKQKILSKISLIFLIKGNYEK